MSRVVEVEVGGRSYRLRSDEGGADIEAAAALVNERLGAILRAAPDLPRERAAILSALNMGDELLRERAEAARVEAAVEALRGRLSELAKRAEETGAPRD